MIFSARAMVMAVAATAVVVPAAAADPAPACGGIAANPSLEETARNGAPDGYVFTPAAPVPPGTPPAKVPKLLSEPGFAVDGQRSAVIQTPDGKASTATQTEKFVPGGVYTLSVSTGSYAPGAGPATGLRFYDVNGAQVQETKLVADHDAADGKLVKQDFPAATAPAKAASVKFFATTSAERLRWDCVDLRLAAYSVKKEVQNPATGAWGPFATVTAGETAHYRVTVTNDGTQDLTGIAVQDPWCSAPFEPFALAAGANKQLTCDHPDLTVADTGHVNTAKVTGVHYPGGTLGDKTASATITVLPPPAIAKIGDFVWADRNRDGVQDPGEPGVADVKVTLKDGAGGTVGTATTDAGGKYGFEKLKDGTYQVCFAVPSGFTPTTKDVAPDDRDSDAGPDGCTAPRTLGGPSREDFTVDLGLVTPTNRIGDFAWTDTNGNGLQDAGEPGLAGVKVTLNKGTSVVTGPDGAYAFTGLEDGSYQLCFTAEGKHPTAKDKGDDAKDSDADPATGCADPRQLGPDKRDDQTVDVGFA
ncbi:carboxypeptidase regulatory-like domain-containing protein [Amycolatopsis sp. OK19-0408]|uniref:Carboxypeptidase regulatory-like domain-containing protein n=1 Tax=Amycolatopsis iheyensis TaxID=2945988 RepID=A0A9X2NLA9_9PSEU|nr:SdrD B-like domain-containing protein [Amycolatopsis iheyensis]MCR6489483.1 carboxypeptidase regulatory-like domain-containing protein [Amycolatopsis iheyensis]